MSAAIVLLAHGSRDPAWRRPFEQIAARIREALPGAEVRIAYLEHGPGLLEALRGVEKARVVPAFLGAGGHVGTDLPRLIGEARAAYPRLAIELDPVIGEVPAVIEAIASVIARR